MKSVGNDIRTQGNNHVEFQFPPKSKAQIWTQIWRPIDIQVKEQVWTQLHTKVRNLK